MLRILTGMRTVRAYVQEENEQRAIRAASNEARRSFFRMHASYSLAAPLIEAIFIPFFVAVVLAAPLIGTPVPSLLAFLVIMYRAVPHLRVFEEARVVLSNYSPSVDAIAGILDLSKVATPHLGHPVESLARDIVFDDVSFRYASNSKDNAVEQVSFRIEKGSMVALVGRSGAGKSTLINIMLGFYRPLKGTVLVDGAPLGGLDLQSWRRRIGFAGQDTQLFPGSIAENIAYGRPEVGRTEIEEAARMAAVVEFTSAMPRGLDTEIGRDGTDLSGGQRQRIALARALLLKPDILLLDEATNALDNVTEAAVQNMLQALSGRITILVIAHRLATIRNADWVVALDGGRIAEQGPPAALLRNDAAFARLYRLETMEFSANPDTGEVPRLRESISPDSSGD
jgi:ABC-type multidrug transport system fused ATPase/permease subunit